MDLNMDLTDWVSCDSHAVSWQTNADDNVARCFLEQAEGGLHSTVVGKFPAGFKLPPHPHPGGEEVFVLEGSFFDADGEYPAGSYLRLPRGWVHATETPGGYTLFVKVGQVPAEDSTRVHLASDDHDFKEVSPGLRRRVLHEFGDEQVFLIRFEPGATADHHVHTGGEELYIIEGDLADDRGHYTAGSWLRFPDGSAHTPHSPSGCLMFVKRGHLSGS